MSTTSEARISANRANAAKSTGPKTDEGKAASRANSFKHGLTGSGVVLSPEDARQVERKLAAIQQELNPVGEIEQTLASRVATLAVRMDRCVAHENAALAERVQQAVAEFEAPEGVDEAEADWLRTQAAKLAMFDPSREAELARKYEASAERGFFRALKDLRALKRQRVAPETSAASSGVAQAQASIAQLGSFLQDEAPAPPPAPRPAAPTPVPASTPSSITAKPQDDPFAMPSMTANTYGVRGIDIPMSIGRAR